MHLFLLLGSYYPYLSYRYFNPYVLDQLVRKVWTVNDFQEEESTQTDLPRYEQYPPKLNFKDFLKPSQIQHVIDKSSDFQGTKKSEMV